MAPEDVGTIRQDLRGMEERLGEWMERLEARIDEVTRRRDECERACGQRRAPIYERLSKLEVGMARAVVQITLLVALAAMVGSTIGGMVLSYLFRHVFGR